MVDVARYLDLIQTVPRLGIGRLAHYAVHRARLRTGAYARTTPAVSWEEIPESHLEGASGGLAHTVADAPEYDPSGSGKGLLDEADRIVQGELNYFSHHWLMRPADWRSNPFNSYSTPLNHWTALRDFATEQGDIKWIWEPSRFDWAHTLGRAWVLSHDERYAEAFWSLLADWVHHNPPNQGVNWKCGQECALRMIVLVWAAPLIDDAKASTGERKGMLWRIVAALADRIEPSIGYALSQFNNHGLSEALGLFISGVSLPNHPRSETRLRKGRKLFEQQVLKQFAPDGSYSQNSMNYERLALKLGVIYLLVCRRSGRPASDPVVGRLRAATGFLRNMMDDATGCLPNYGPNDGANLMSLSSCGYGDFRPTLQLASVVLDARRIFGTGPWDEEAAWLCGENIEEHPLEIGAGESMCATDGGYYCIREKRDLAFVRCHTHKSRPGHADMLHLDLWRDGVNLLCDSGTYQYYDPKRNWGTYFASTAAHNTLMVDEHDQMTRLGLFLWGSWARSQVKTIRKSETEAGLCFVGEHDGYLKRFGIRHRRSLLYRNGDWLIVDDAIYEGQGSHDLTLAWHLDAAWEYDEPSGRYRHPLTGAILSVHGEGLECADHRGEEHYPEGARSLYYGDVEPITFYTVRANTAQSFRFVTALTEGDELVIESGVVSWHGLRIPVRYSTEPWI